MKLLIAFVLSLWPLVTFAQVPTQPVTPAAAPCTAAAPYAPWVFGSNDAGWWAAQWHGCVGGGSDVTVRAVTHAAVVSVLDANTVVSAVAAVSSLWMAGDFSVPPISDVWRPAMPAIMVAKPLPPGAWKVAPYSVQTTRPAFYVLNGTRGGQSPNTRASVGIACDCTAPIVEGGTTYCPFAGASAPPLVAVCSKP